MFPLSFIHNNSVLKSVMSPLVVKRHLNLYRHSKKLYVLWETGLSTLYAGPSFFRIQRPFITSEIFE